MSTIMTELKELIEMRNNGDITNEEFSEIKSTLLGEGQSRETKAMQEKKEKELMEWFSGADGQPDNIDQKCIYFENEPSTLLSMRELRDNDSNVYDVYEKYSYRHGMRMALSPKQVLDWKVDKKKQFDVFLKKARGELEEKKHLEWKKRHLEWKKRHLELEKEAKELKEWFKDLGEQPDDIDQKCIFFLDDGYTELLSMRELRDNSGWDRFSYAGRMRVILDPKQALNWKNEAEKHLENMTHMTAKCILLPTLSSKLLSISDILTRRYDVNGYKVEVKAGSSSIQICGGWYQLVRDKNGIYTCQDYKQYERL